MSHWLRLLILNGGPNRLLRLFALIFAVAWTAVLGTITPEHSTSAPLYAVLAATTFAAERIPVKSTMRAPIVRFRGRGYLMHVDLWTGATLEILAGAAAITAAAHWLWSSPAVEPTYVVIGAMIGLAGAALVTYTFVTKLVSSLGGDADEHE